VTDEDIASRAASAAPAIGAQLSRLRRAAGMTGQQLAGLVGMSQPTISRIERGVTVPGPADVEKLARALHAPQALIDDLVEQAEHAHEGRMTDWRPTRGAVANIQREVEQLEGETRTFRVFQPTVVVGLAQTSEYARAVLGVTHAVRTGVSAEGGFGAVPEAVSVRMHRQVALVDPRKQFHFVMTEAVLNNRVVRAEHMPAQIERIREVARQPNVTVAIVPADAPLAIPPYHGFELLDDRLVIVDVYNTLLTTRGQSDIATYVRAFESFERLATTEIDPILDRYHDMYLDLSRRSRGAAQA
jgi:transcriptional regulator with XRE-family HTH domain